MSWFYQPLPLASTFSVTDVDEALTGEEFETEHGTLTQSASALLSGQVSVSGQGSVTIVDDEEQLQGQEADVEQGSLSVNNLVVRLRSRKVGGTSTAENILQSQASAVQQGNPVKVLSVLLGGSGITSAQQSFPTRTRACLLTGQVRTTHQGTVVYQQTGGGTGTIPSWVQLPTVSDEIAYYDTAFPLGEGKDIAWTWTSTDQSPTETQGGFSVQPPASLALEGPGMLHSGNGPKGIHEDSEGDDLWNHYMQYKRTGEQKYLNWATAWATYFTNVYPTDMGPTGGEDSGGRSFDHLYGQGLIMWGMERNDVAAKNAALTLAANAESNTLALVPGVTNPTGRRLARRLIFYNYMVMMEPISRWINCRDHLIEVWLQSPGWVDTTDALAPTVVGGNHCAPRQSTGPVGEYSADAGWSTQQYDEGFRFNASWFLALHVEALWLSYKMTGRTDIRDMLIQQARYVLHYAWDPLLPNPMCGSRWGHKLLTSPPGPYGSQTHLHDYADEFVNTTGQNGVRQNPPPPLWTDTNFAPTSNLEASMINCLVYGYKLTGEKPFLKRAREHYRQATQYSGATGHATRLAADQVHFFADTQNNSDNIYFNYNKGMLQYCSRLFENGGNPTLEASAAFQPPYPVPTSPGEVVQIAGKDNAPRFQADGITPDYSMGGNSAYSTNVWADVSPAEVGARASNKIFNGADTASGFFQSFSQAGIIGAAGGGGHHAMVHTGFGGFDFTDAVWKRIWTTQGNPGVDNITQATKASPVDRRLGTRTHNILTHDVPDVLDNYNLVSGHADIGGRCWNHNHWFPSAEQQSICTRTADPRDQTFEIAYLEPAAGTDGGVNDHGWQFPGEWNGDHSQDWPGRYTRYGYLAPSLRHEPTVAGTIAPDQSECPTPSHIWDMFFEQTPDQGGGPLGSVVCARHTYLGESGKGPMHWSHAFDLHKGYWRQYSTNAPATGSSTPTADVTAGNGLAEEGATSGCTDPVGQRFFVIGQRYLTKEFSGARITYINFDDRQWRHAWVGSAVGVSGSPRTENLWCDPDRRLLLMTPGGASTAGTGSSFLRALDLSVIPGQATPGAILPFSSSGSTAAGFRPIAYTNVNPAVPLDGTYFIPFVYYPPNGKYYRFIARPSTSTSGWPQPGQGLTTANMNYYYANTATGRDLRVQTKLQRITPPPIIANPPAGYYTNSTNWTFDEITLSQPVPRGSFTQMFQALGAKWFRYIPALQCLAWCPLNTGTSVGEPETTYGVYLIKPF